MRKKAKPGDTDETIKNAARKYLESVGYAAPE
jgi:hypothetical protein